MTTGDEITSPKLIARRYIFGEFYIDLLSTIPFTWIPINSLGYYIFGSFCKLLKVLRIRKMYASISQANLTVESKALTKIAFYSFLIIVYTHIVACVMWFTFKTDYQWVAPTDFGAVRSRMQDPWKMTGDLPIPINDYR